MSGSNEQPSSSKQSTSKQRHIDKSALLKATHYDALPLPIFTTKRPHRFVFQDGKIALNPSLSAVQSTQDSINVAGYFNLNRSLGGKKTQPAMTEVKYINLSLSLTNIHL